jgi:phospho-2-dehydro-3-deoxyheptonate aldolase
VYGQSITDACMDVDTTAGVLSGLAAAARGRRERDRGRSGGTASP